MGKPVMIVVPDFIYGIYEEAAKILGNTTTAEAMCSALITYAQLIFEEMEQEGQLPDHQLKIYKG